MTYDPQFEFGQAYDVLPPKKVTVLPITLLEWRHLKDKLCRVIVHHNKFMTIASFLGGTALSTLIAILTGQITGDNYKIGHIVWISSAIIAAITWLYGRTLKEYVAERVADIHHDMDVIEKRFEIKKDG